MNFDNVLKMFEGKHSSKRFAKSTKCEDAYWGRLINGNVEENGRVKIDGKAFQPNSLKHNNVIVVVAESPHIYEYSFKNNKIIFKSPLHKNDKKIKRYLENNSNQWIDKRKDYDIVLVNAIQYQCSKGLPLWGHKDNQNLKNKIFEYAWNNENGKKDLLNRINNIIENKNTVIIINACTLTLKKFCNSSIFSSKNNVSFSIYDDKHPSHW